MTVNCKIFLLAVCILGCSNAWHINTSRYSPLINQIMLDISAGSHPYNAIDSLNREMMADANIQYFSISCNDSAYLGRSNSNYIYYKSAEDSAFYDKMYSSMSDSKLSSITNRINDSIAISEEIYRYKNSFRVLHSIGYYYKSEKGQYSFYNWKFLIEYMYKIE